MDATEITKRVMAVDPATLPKAPSIPERRRMAEAIKEDPDWTDNEFGRGLVLAVMRGDLIVHSNGNVQSTQEGSARARKKVQQ